MGNVERSHTDAMFGVIMLMSGMSQDSVFMHYYDQLGGGHEGEPDTRREGHDPGAAG